MSVLIFDFSFVFFWRGGHICTDHADYSAGFCLCREAAALRYIQSVPLSPALTALAPSMLRGAQEGGRDDQQSCVVLVLRSDPIPPNQTIERVCVLVGAVRLRLPSREMFCWRTNCLWTPHGSLHRSRLFPRLTQRESCFFS